MIEVKTLDELDNIILTNEKCVVNFGYESFEPTKIVKRTMKRVEKEYDGVMFVYVDECVSGATEKYEIHTYPTTLFIKDGVVAQNVRGLISFEKFKELIDSL